MRKSFVPGDGNTVFDDVSLKIDLSKLYVDSLYPKEGTDIQKLENFIDYINECLGKGDFEVAFAYYNALLAKRASVTLLPIFPKIQELLVEGSATVSRVYSTKQELHSIETAATLPASS